MFRMIVADDEQMVLNGIKRVIPWEEYNIEIIAEATDGQDAYDLCLKLHPDILFTDIRMPLMDGLEVAMRLNEQESDIKIIIFSGAQDFEFAKTALNIDVEGYILKPIKVNELKQVVNKVINRINMERSREQKMQQMVNQLHENMALMKEKFLRNLISGSYSNKEDVDDKLEYFQITMGSCEDLLVAIAQIDDYSKSIRDHSEEEKQLLCFSINNTLNEIVASQETGFCFTVSENEFVIIFLDVQKNIRYLDICEEIIQYIGKLYGLTVSIGLGNPVMDVLQLPKSYKSAKDALQYKFYSGKGSLLSIADVDKINGISKDMRNVEYSNLYEAENKLVSHVRMGDGTAVTRIIDEIFNNLAEAPVDYIVYCCIEAVSIASRAIYELGDNIDTIVGKRSRILDDINRMEDVFDLKTYMNSVFGKMAGYFSVKYEQRNRRMIEKINKLIEQNYMEDIDLKNISSEVYLSPNYISLIYKKVTGESVIEHLTRLRMEAARELLRTTDLKIYEIAVRVGYENQYYFSSVFKKYNGMHPMKFKNSSV